MPRRRCRQRAAGEVSFLPSADLEVPRFDTCQRGMTEATTSASGLVQAARESGLSYGSAEEVFEGAAIGDVQAQAVVEAEGRRIGTLITAVAAILDPELVVLGGGVGRNLDVLGDAISRRIAELGPLRPRIVASDLSDGGVLLDAVARALDVARVQLFERSSHGA